MNGNEKLRRAAREEFARLGYKKASMAAIAKRATMAVGNVYKLYPSKQALFLDVYFAENRMAKQRVVQRVDWAEPARALAQFLQYNLQETQGNKILEQWHGSDIGPTVREACIKRGEARHLNDLLRDKLALWRQQNLIVPDVTDEFLFELFDMMNEIDAQLDARAELKLFIMQAVIEKVTIDRQAA